MLLSLTFTRLARWDKAKNNETPVKTTIGLNLEHVFNLSTQNLISP